MGKLDRIENTRIKKNNICATPLDDAKATVCANLKALEDGNVTAYLRSIDTSCFDALQLQSIQNQMKELFQRFQVSYRLESIQCVYESADSVKLRVVQTARSDDPHFSNNRNTILHLVEQIQGKWLIRASVSERVEPLQD